MEKKDRECDAKNKEKDETMETLNKMKDKLEREISEHKQAKRQVEDLSLRLQHLGSVRSPPNVTSEANVIKHIRVKHLKLCRSSC